MFLLLCHYSTLLTRIPLPSLFTLDNPAFVLVAGFRFASHKQTERKRGARHLARQTWSHIPRKKTKENIDQVEEVFEIAQSVKQIRLDHLGSPPPVLEILRDPGSLHNKHTALCEICSMTQRLGIVVFT